MFINSKNCLSIYAQNNLIYEVWYFQKDSLDIWIKNSRQDHSECFSKLFKNIVELNGQVARHLPEEKLGSLWSMVFIQIKPVYRLSLQW